MTAPGLCAGRLLAIPLALVAVLSSAAEIPSDRPRFDRGSVKLQYTLRI